MSSIPAAGTATGRLETMRLHVRTAAESYRRLLRPGSDVLFIPPVHVSDLYLTQPATWLRTMIAQHGGVQLEAA